MKKFIFPVVVGTVLMMAASSLTSCKKDYTCTCNDSVIGQTIYPLNDSKKDDAEEACDGLNAAEQLIGGSCTLSD